MAEVFIDSPQLAQNSEVEQLAPKRRKPDPDELAQELEDKWADKLSYFYGDWWKLINGCWEKRQLPEIHDAARKFLRKCKEEKYDIRVSMSLAREVVALAETELFMPDRKLMDLAELQQPYINVQNGLYNLETHELEPHRADLFFTNQSPIVYDEQAECPVFDKFLETSLVSEDGKPDKEMARLLCQAMAYSMTARTDLKASFWLIGQPNSGKSKLIGLLKDLMGSLHMTIDLNQLATNRFLLSGIVGKRIVTFTEAAVGSFLPDAIYKALVGGGDEIYADVKNKPGISFVPLAKFWWAMNDAPRTNDNSLAIVNRLHPIIFNRSIPENEQIKDLDKRFRAELPGILNRLMLHYRGLKNNNWQFERPAESMKWLDEYKLRNDKYQMFINEACILQPEGKIQGTRLFAAYKDWAIENGFNVGDSRPFTLALKRIGIESHFINGLIWWYGIAPKINGWGL